jgi:hypothetical protein
VEHAALPALYDDDPDEPASNKTRRHRRFGSFTPGANPKRLWLAFTVIALIGLVGVSLLFMI